MITVNGPFHIYESQANKRRSALQPVGWEIRGKEMNNTHLYFSRHDPHSQCGERVGAIDLLRVRSMGSGLAATAKMCLIAGVGPASVYLWTAQERKLRFKVDGILTGKLIRNSGI